MVKLYEAKYPVWLPPVWFNVSLPQAAYILSNSLLPLPRRCAYRVNNTSRRMEVTALRAHGIPDVTPRCIPSIPAAVYVDMCIGHRLNSSNVLGDEGLRGDT
ncbi:hypothetical protein DBV15_11542 [Temnothorax longispinosus]|uniref:Uncharacterized protein n=1 Tax=Temnothorax longispinosus TaxID=300112 RepID=A0A4S2KK50_9HYME|nr:hypothetical protein DBV15_11542 [Temnothorax longispinosus]